MRGVIDAGYRGPIVFIFFNFSSDYCQICEGDRIAQMLFQKIAHAVKLIEVKNFDHKTARGAGGFGSTNKTCLLNVQ